MTSFPKLYFKKIILGFDLEEQSIGFLISKLPVLSYLSLRKCYGIQNKYLMEAVKRSKSLCLKINTWEGIITWKCASKECRFDLWSQGPDELELQKRLEQNKNTISTMMNPKAAEKAVTENLYTIQGKKVFYGSPIE